MQHSLLIINFKLTEILRRLGNTGENNKVNINDDSQLDSTRLRLKYTGDREEIIRMINKIMKDTQLNQIN